MLTLVREAPPSWLMGTSGDEPTTITKADKTHHILMINIRKLRDLSRTAFLHDELFTLTLPHDLGFQLLENSFAAKHPVEALCWCVETHILSSF